MHWLRERPALQAELFALTTSDKDGKSKQLIVCITTLFRGVWCRHLEFFELLNVPYLIRPLHTTVWFLTLKWLFSALNVQCLIPGSHFHGIR
jgi:hypothetical protein